MAITPEVLGMNEEAGGVGQSRLKNWINPKLGRNPPMVNGLLGVAGAAAGKAVDSASNGSSGYSSSKTETTVTPNTPKEIQDSLGRVEKQRKETQESLEGKGNEVSKLHKEAAGVQTNAASSVDYRNQTDVHNIQATRNKADNLLGDVLRQLREAQQEAVVDPDRIFREPGTDGNPGDISLSKKTMSAIAVALGAMGASLGGGQNYAMEIVQSAIERDIQAQKDSYQQKMKDIMLQRQVALDEKSLAELDVITSEMARANILMSTQAQLGALSSLESGLLATPTFKQMQLNIETGVTDTLSRGMESWRSLRNSQDSVGMGILVDWLSGPTPYAKSGEGFLSTRDRVLGPRESWTGRPQAFGSDWRSP